MGKNAPGASASKAWAWWDLAARHNLWIYALSPVMIWGTWMVRHGVPNGIFPASPFFLGDLMVLISAAFGGIGPGIFAIANAVLAASILHYESRGSLRIDAPREQFEVMCFIGEALLIVWVCWGMQTARRRLARQGTQLHRTNAKLEAEATTRMQAQSLLSSSENLLRLITHALPSAVAYVDASRRIRFCNDVVAKWYARQRDDIIGSTVEEVMGANAFGLETSPLDRALNGEFVEVESEVVHADRRRYVNTHFLPDVEGEGKVRGILLLVTDISDYRAYQLELIRAKDAADAANRAKSAFLANMSHEIRTPLGAILGFSDLLESPDESPELRQKWMAAIRRNGQLLSVVINDILDLSKVEAGQLRIETAEVPLSEVISDLGMLLRLQAEEKGIILKVEFQGVVPAKVRTDALRLRQILLNIVGNAIKFTERGAVTVTIAVQERSAGGPLLRFEVEDTGIGIDPDQAKNLFIAFSQADASTTRRFGGSGLGLVLARRLAQALGGDVELVRSELGKGSLFVVTIDPGALASRATMPPLALPVSANAGARAVSPPPKVQAQPLKGLRILLVDDSADNLLLVSRLLAIAGAEVAAADCGSQGLQLAATTNFDVALLDIQMPVMDGFETLNMLRQRGFKGPIVALTAHALAEERRRSIVAGFADHLCKPVKRQELYAALSVYVRSIS